MITRGYKNWARLAAVAAAAAVVVGCGDDPVAAVVPPPAGFVVQLPVVGATVFADRLAGGKRGVMDPDEIRASTDSSGRFQLPSVPTYDYELISAGGTDTSGRPGISMRAAGGTAGSAPTTDVLTPLTTLVQLTPAGQQRDTVIARIRSLGVEPTARIDEAITPAAAALVKAVTTTITVVTQAVSNSSQDGGGNSVPLSGEANNAIQSELIRSLGATLVSTATPLASIQAIEDLTKNATEDALNALTSATQTLLPDGVSINVTNISAVATTVSQSAAAVATSIAGQGSTLSTSDAKPEDEIVNEGVATAIAAQQVQAIASASAVVAAVVPANKPPAISGSSTASGVLGRAFSYSPTIADPDGDVTSVAVSSGTLPAGLSLDAVTGVISGTPTAEGVRSIVLTVSDGRNGSATLPVTITITPPPTGGVGTGGGIS